MEKVRFDLHLPAVQRLGLDALSGETGLSRADLVRLSVRYMLQNPTVILRSPAVADAQAEVQS
jgi:hypothetical protein